MLTRHMFALLLVMTGTACSSSNSTAGAADSGATTTEAGLLGVDTSTTVLSGVLGSLGAAQPTVSSLMINNSGETLIYFSSAPLSCDQLKTSRWLGTATKGSQVVEIVVKGDPVVGDVAVHPAEVNYAEGGRSSAYETIADSGKVVFTKADAKSVVEGTFSATYPDGTTLTGTFHADFCVGGQGY